MARKTRKSNRSNQTKRRRTTNRKHGSRYTRKDFSSGDGMLTRVWGPSLWHTMHTMSFNYPTNPTLAQKRHYRNFILNLQHTLPCGKCRANFVKNLKAMPITMGSMKSRSTFSKYVYDLHETVNRMLNKTSGLTYEMVRERYEHFRARCTTEDLPIPVVHPVKQTRKRKESGCTEPLYGKKSKCVIKIVPDSERVKTFHVNKSCERGRK